MIILLFYVKKQFLKSFFYFFQLFFVFLHGTNEQRPMITDNRTEIAKSMTKFWDTMNVMQRDQFIKAMIVVHPNHGEVFFRKGDEPLYMHYLVSGHVMIYQEIDADHRHLVRLVEPGAVFGMQSAFSSEFYRYTAISGDNTTVALIPLHLVFHLIWESPGFALIFIQQLSDLLGTSVEHTIHLTQKHIRGRLAESILHVLGKYGTGEDGQTISIYLSRSDLALMSNMTTSNAIRTLSAFASEGLIALNGRKIKILDKEKLRRVSEIG